MYIGFGPICRSGCASCHSRASAIAFESVSAGLKTLFSKIFKFRVIQMFQTIQGNKGPM